MFLIDFGNFLVVKVYITALSTFWFFEGPLNKINNAVNFWVFFFFFCNLDNVWVVMALITVLIAFLFSQGPLNKTEH